MENVREKPIELMILRFLDLKGIDVWQNPTQGVYDPVQKKFRKPMSKYKIKGGSDILGFLGKPLYQPLMFGIEVKTPKELAYLEKHYDTLRVYVGTNKKKKHLREQIEFVERLQRGGHIAFFAASLEDVKLKFLSYGVEL